jgi:hypothetical protein
MTSGCTCNDDLKGKGKKWQLSLDEFEHMGTLLITVVEATLSI